MRIAVIGGGAAGLVSAWLLEETHQVTLFEKDDRLGGHADTRMVEIDGVEHTVDAGVHFLSDHLSPRTMRLLRHLEVPLESYRPTATFCDRRDGWTICLPPLGSIARATGLTDPRTLRALAALRRLIDAAIELERDGDFSLTLEDFLAAIPLPPAICRDFIFPYLSSYWGVSPEEVRTYSARNALSYLVRMRPPLIRPPSAHRTIGGMRAYVSRLAATMTRTSFVRGAAVSSLSRRGDGYAIDGRPESFDQLVLATNAEEGRRLLATLGADALVELLGAIEYFDTTIAVHSDPSFMPPHRAHWSAVNAMFDGRWCAITNREEHDRGVDLFRSWITHAERKPERCHAEVKYRHPRPNPSYFACQHRLEPHQGKNNLWLAGMYVTGYDNHDGAIASALRIAHQLAPGTTRIRSQDPDRDATVGSSILAAWR